MRKRETKRHKLTRYVIGGCIGLIGAGLYAYLCLVAWVADKLAGRE